MLYLQSKQSENARWKMYFLEVSRKMEVLCLFFRLELKIKTSILLALFMSPRHHVRGDSSSSYIHGRWCIKKKRQRDFHKKYDGVKKGREAGLFFRSFCMQRQINK